MDKVKNYNDYTAWVKGQVVLGKRPGNRQYYRTHRSEFSEYYEFHHIIPKSLGGDDSEDNVIPLTAREHILAHYLLCYIYSTGKAHYSMLNALSYLIESDTSQKPIFNTAKILSLISSKIISNRMMEKINLLSDFQKVSNFSRSKDWRENISKSKLGENNGNYGKKWYNNGIEEIAAFECPDGWVPGRIKKTTISKCRKIFCEETNKIYDSLLEVENELDIRQNHLSSYINNLYPVYNYNLKFIDEPISVYPEDIISLAESREKPNKSTFRVFTPLEQAKYINSETIKKFKTFPYESYTKNELLHDFDLLKTLDSKNSHNGLKLIGQFHKSIYTAHVGKELSAYEAWHDMDIMKKLINNRCQYLENPNISAKDLRRGLTVSKLGPKPSIFQPAFAKYLIKTYLAEFNTIFDPFSGFSGRYLGAISTGKNYIGQDIDPEHIKESQRLQKFLKDKTSSFAIQDILSDTKKSYECLLTCPPYNLKETWGTELKDLSCDEWIDVCLKNYSCKKYVFVVDKTEKYKDFIVEGITNESHFNKNSECVICVS